MHSCYICDKKFVSFDSLILHFKHDEFLTPSSTYSCHQIGCPLKFQNLYSFKKHYLKNHSNVPHCNNIMPSVTKGHINAHLNINHEPPYSNSGTNSYIADQSYDQSTDTTVESIIEMITKTILDFKSTLHSKHNLSRKDVQEIQTAVSAKITEPIFSAIINIILPKISCEADKTMVSKLLQYCSNPFELIESEHMFLKHLKDANVYAESTEFVINDSTMAVLSSGHPIIKEVKLTGTLMPISFIFKRFFELPNVLQKTLDNMRNLKDPQNEKIRNFINGKVWEEKSKHYPNKILIPFFLYFDEFEINDPLKPHSCSIGAALINFPTIPSEFLSVLENIFPVLFFKTEYKKYGNKATFDLLIDQINLLQKNGLEIVTSQGTFTVHFILGLVIGDNLGLHTILGYIRNFSNSNYPCRTCKMHKSETRSSVLESPYLLRNLDNYKLDVLTDNLTLTGIYEDSAFNRVDHYHVVQNYYCDIMHDLFEGVCKYVVCDLILYYTEQIKLFSLTTLNNRKQLFDYGDIESGNISSAIRIEDVWNSKLKLTARETWTFMSLLPLMIGDLIPEECEIWNMFCKLSELVDICLESTFTERNISLLQTLVQQFNSAYILHFKKDLKPKFHFLVHYSTIIRQSGPLKYLWNFRNEGKLREYKIYARSITSRTNITKSFAIKSMLGFANRLIGFRGLKEDIEFSPRVETYTNIQNKNYFEHISDWHSLDPSGAISYKFVAIKGTMFKINHFVCDFTDDDINIYRVVDILKIGEIFFFVLMKFVIVEFNQHFQCYVLGDSCDIYKISIINSFKYFPSNVHLMSNGKYGLKFRPF